MFRFLFGLALGISASTAVAQLSAECGQGELTGYVVQKDGEDVCENPKSFVKFRGDTSYIVCE